MTLNEYQRETERTRGVARPASEKRLAVFGLGITGEAGEVADIVKKFFDRGRVIDKANMVLELGDVLWYVAALATEIGSSLDEVAIANIRKLEARYPNGWTREDGE